MLGRPVRTLLFGAVAVGCAVGPASAGGHHRGRRHPYGYYGGYPGTSLYVGAGYAPGVAFGVSRYPVAVGFALPFGPSDPRGSIRTLVHPRDAEVFIDGYYVGVVDDFDGSLQGLRLEPGPHAVTLYRDGFRVHEETLYSTLGATVKIRHEMEPLLPGEPVPPRPSPGGAPVAAPSAPPASSPPSPATSPAVAVTSGTGTGGATVTAVDYGTLVLRVSPPDAELWIDGELWQVRPGPDRFVLHLPAGAHALELTKEGFEGYAAHVEVAAGEATALNVLLGAPLSP
jgi:hypothetical protein